MADISIPNLKFPEGPRWHDGTLWLSDQLGGRIWRVDDQGAATSFYELDHPSGLGFPPDGGVLVASMDQMCVMRIVEDRIEKAIDLTSFGTHLNDMVVDRRGRVYLDVYEDYASRDSLLVLACPGEAPRIAARGLAFPNGVAVTPDGERLLVSESFAERVTEFDVAPDGTLSNRRTWAQVAGMAPDGLCLDAEGGIWVASYLQGEFLHLRRGGEVLERISFPDRWAMACALGGPDGRTLFLCTAQTTTRSYLKGQAEGFVESRRVDVAGVGCP
jgi:sugar lactone lactonase YvrE